MTTRIGTPEFATERRRYKRWSLNLAVRVIRPDVHVLRAVDIGAGGVYCPNAPARQPGETMLLEIDLGPQKCFVAAAKVVGPRGASGLRLQFLLPQHRLEAELHRLAS
jgi:hypothetical protein